MTSNFESKRNFWIVLAIFGGLLGEWLLARRGEVWTLWGGLIFIVLSLALIWKSAPVPGSSRTGKVDRPSSGGWLWLALTLGIGIFFRWYKLDLVPAGLFLDEAGWGWGAERILYEGWRPFYDSHWRPFYETARFGVWELLSYYLLASWFWILGASKSALFSFSDFFSLLASVLAYWAFRQWGSARTARVALFFMVTLRWYLNFSRCAHPAYDVPFYLCGTLALWLYAHRTDRGWAWLACVFFVSAGFYAYPTLLAMPLLVLFWACYEMGQKGADRSRLLRRYTMGFILAAVLSFPVWISIGLGHGFGGRVEGDYFFSKSSPKMFFDFILHLIRFVLMFDRHGENWPVHNWPGHPTVDGVTGFLFAVGFLYAVRYWREKSFFYSLSGLAVMAVPGLLSVSDQPSSHVTGMIPFMVYLAAWALVYLWDSLKINSQFSRNAFRLGFFLILGGMAGSNFYVYFYRQQVDPEVCSAFFPEETAVGERVARGSENEFYLSPKFFGNIAVDFLAFKKASDLRKLDFWDLPLPGPPKTEKAVLFALDEGKTGLLQLLQRIYPQGTVETYEYFKGWPIVYFYRVPAGSPQWSGPIGGLQGIYRLSVDGSGPPVLIRRDPLLNFTFRNDFGLGDFKTLSIRWSGSIRAPETGLYSFLSLTTDSSAVWVDGRKILEGQGAKEGTVGLTPGVHRIQVNFQKVSGVDTAFTLSWKKPGDTNYQVIPFWQRPASVKAVIPTAKP